ncbi:lysostaphin resistance A-like protein [Methanobacterium sp.]|uniref:CPBP family intramembrane glutamic endopeptidase n=1 Tax=Methanobacterium sp. TaxID=2164 RepID=UPI003C75B7D0
MNKKGAKTTFDVKINPSDLESQDNFPNYKKSLKIFENHEREIKVRKVITDLEDRQIRLKFFKKELIILTIYLLSIVAAEIVTAHYSIEYGLIMHTIILFALLINSSVTHSTKFSYLLRSMMILPMIRIIGLTIPLMQVNELYWFPVIAIPLFAASFTLIKSQKLTWKKVGLILGSIPLQLTIALSGVVLGFTEYLILKPQPLISSFNLETVLFGALILIISTGFAEELLFRGILQKNAEKILGKLFGLLYVSILFTALHIGWNSFLDLIFVFGVAIFYGYTFQKTGSLFGITLSHGISNSFLFLIMPFIFPLLMH